jgi:hypothetical protein
LVVRIYIYVAFFGCAVCVCSMNKRTSHVTHKNPMSPLLQGTQRITTFPESSKCHQALLNEPDERSKDKIIPVRSRLGIDDSQRTTPTLLSVVNSGSGTTGTHAFFDSMCQYDYKGVHFRLSCNYPADVPKKTIAKRQALEQWHVMITQCVLSFSQKKSCQSQRMLNKLKIALVDALSVIEFITDSPTDVIFSELIAIAPKIQVVGTYRNPTAWAKRRSRTHTTQLICRPELWSHPTILHPFDLLGCLQHSNTTFPSSALMSIFEYLHGVDLDTFRQSSEQQRGVFALEKGHDVKQIEKAYQLMNIMNLRLLQDRHIQFLPICLWDLPKRNNSVLHDMIGTFLTKKTWHRSSGEKLRLLSEPRGDDELMDAIDHHHHDPCLKTAPSAAKYSSSPSIGGTLAVSLFAFETSLYNAAVSSFILICIVLLSKVGSRRTICCSKSKPSG